MIPAFEIKENMYVYCIDVNGMEKYLTYNKQYFVYEVLSNEGRIAIQDDSGNRCHAKISRFQRYASAFPQEGAEFSRLQMELAGVKFDLACREKRIDHYKKDEAELKNIIMQATRLISSNVTKLRRWSNPNSHLGKDMEAIANDNSKFLAENPEYFNKLLMEIQQAKTAIGEEVVPTLSEETVKQILADSAEGAQELHNNLKDTFTPTSEQANRRLD